VACCATDNLAGYLDGLEVSREDCETLIMHARLRVGWITETEFAVYDARGIAQRTRAAVAPAGSNSAGKSTRRTDVVTRSGFLDTSRRDQTPAPEDALEAPTHSSDAVDIGDDIAPWTQPAPCNGSHCRSSSTDAVVAGS
jgi:hypothetical protein